MPNRPSRRFPRRRRASTKRSRALNPRQRSAVSNIVVKTIKRRGEWKHFTAKTVTTADTTGSVTDLSVIAQGLTDITRVGDTITASTMNVKYFAFTADTRNFLRLIFFQWYDDSTPVVGDILIDVAGSNVRAMYNTDQAPNFKIIHDKTLMLAERVAGQTFPSQLTTRKLRIPRSKVQYQGASTTGIGKVWLLLLSDSGVATHPGFELTSKLNYQDC